MPTTRQILFGALLLLALRDVLACSCARWSEEQKFAKASHVFVARITGTKVIPNPADAIFPELVRAEFKVLEILKGRAGRPSYVESGKPRIHGADCSIELAPGGTFLFFLYDGSASVGTCSSKRIQEGPSSSKSLDYYRTLKRQ